MQGDAVLKVVHFNTMDAGGGAGKASATLHNSLLELGIDSSLFVKYKRSGNPSVIEAPVTGLQAMYQKMIPYIDSTIIIKIYRPFEMWSLGLAGGSNMIFHPKVQEADIVSLSWVPGFLGIDAIGKMLNCGKPVVWTLYDTWAFTGGCHYSGECDRYEKSCGHCPQLGQSAHWDLSNWVWERKKRKWNTDRLTVVCPSRWLANCAKKSSLLGHADIKIIPSGVDISRYKPASREDARRAMDLPEDRKLILFVAAKGFQNERKGGPLLNKALDILHQKYTNEICDIVVLGTGHLPDEITNRYRIHGRSFYDEASLALLYSACDVLVVPSKADNLPLTVLEAMACGTPCVAFNIGGMPDVIEHMCNGYLATPFDCEDLAYGIHTVLCDEERKAMLSRKAVEKIHSGFTAELEAQQYLKLYGESLPDHQIAC